LQQTNKRVTKTELCYFKFLCKAKNLNVNKINNNEFNVQSSTDNEVLYSVFADINMCECIDGQGGAFCKHFCAVHEKFSNISTALNLSYNDRSN